MNYIIKLPGRYYQGDGIISNLREYTKHLGDKCLVCISNNGIVRYKSTLDVSLKECSVIYMDVDTSFEYDNMEVDFVIGIGGGNVIDRTKIVATKINKPYVIIPTILSSDAACSSTSVPTKYDDVNTMIFRATRNPDIVIADTKILSSTPEAYLLSGIGDALATRYEAYSCYNTTGYTMTHGSTIRSLLYMTDSLLADLVSYSNEAIRYVKVSDYSYKWCFDGIVRSILFDSSILSENLGIALPHVFSSAIDKLYPYNNVLHGYKVALGLLVHLLIVEEESYNFIKHFMDSIGLPTRLRDLPIIKDVDLNLIANEMINNKSIVNTAELSVEDLESYLSKIY